MSKVSMKEVNELKNLLKNKFKEIFEIKKYKDLTDIEKKVYKKYRSNDVTAIYANQAYNSLTEDEKVVYNRVKEKLNGKKANCINTRDSLKVLKDAYSAHKEHDKPSWYQMFYRFIYWWESKIIKKFEKKINRRGVSINRINIAKNEINQLFLLDEIDNLYRIKKEIDINNNGGEYEQFDLNHANFQNAVLFMDNEANRIAS